MVIIDVWYPCVFIVVIVIDGNTLDVAGTAVVTIVPAIGFELLASPSFVLLLSAIHKATLQIDRRSHRLRDRDRCRLPYPFSWPSCVRSSSLAVSSSMW